MKATQNTYPTLAVLEQDSTTLARMGRPPSCVALLNLLEHNTKHTQAGKADGHQCQHVGAVLQQFNCTAGGGWGGLTHELFFSFLCFHGIVKL